MSTEIAEAPLREIGGRWAGGVVVGKLLMLDDPAYVTGAYGDWTRWSVLNRRPAPLFNWPSVYNFNVSSEAPALALDVEGGAQALMLVRIGHVVRCAVSPRPPLVYVAFLEVAPRNRIDAPRRLFRGIGPLMLRFACDLSVQHGYGGRIGLHAVDSAEAFYRRLAFEAHDCPSEFNEVYFELDEDRAQALLLAD